MPCLKLAEIEGIGQRKHRQPVLDRWKALNELFGDALGRGVRADELRVVGLNRAQAAHQLVVFGVADLRLRLDVIEVVMPGDLEAQLFGLYLRVLYVINPAGHGEVQYNNGSVGGRGVADSSGDW